VPFTRRIPEPCRARQSTRNAASTPALLAVVAGIALGLAFLAIPAAAQRQPALAHSIELTGTIDPATAAWLEEALSDAQEARARVAIVRLDTPGGLDSSMREIVQRILATDLPVVVYVSPDGARAASAGLFVTMSADVAAMAPQTNIGSATPVQVGPGPRNEVLERKAGNDAAAYVRALADRRGRNADLAERMVRDAVNVEASQAIREDLIDRVATSERALLRQLDGFRVEGPKAQVLDTTGVQIERREMGFQYEVRQLLVNPTVAFLLLMVGLVGVAIELATPGALGPGALGGVALVLGLYGTAQLPVTLVGVLLILLALGLFIAETQVASGGVLGVAGVGALVASGLLLYDTDSPVYDVSVPAAVVGGALLGGLVVLITSKALATRRRPARGGTEDLVGERASARTALDPVGQVFVGGALWRARVSGGARLQEGDAAKVEAIEGLTLHVRPVGPEDESPTGEHREGRTP
jgi:membrane-bound serine protease (ClpP class)